MNTEKTPALLALAHAAFSYRDEPVLRDASLEVRAGELVVLLGENGAGKSTVIKLLLGELAPTSGEARVLGRPATALAPRDWTQVGYVPQAQVAGLAAFPATVEEIVRASVAGPRRAARGRAQALLAELGLTPLARHLLGELSGGQLQRVALARALANQPRALLLDEPTSGLDLEAAEGLTRLVCGLADAGQTAVLLVTHDMARLGPLLGERASRVLRLRDGEVSHA